MSRFVVDASVVAKWFTPEKFSDRALRLAEAGHDLSAPDLLVAELASILRKLVLRSDLSREAAVQLAGVLPVSSITLVPSATLTQSALRIALDHERSTYDSLYVALAQREACQFVTADLRLYNALQDSMPERMLWIGDV